MTDKEKEIIELKIEVSAIHTERRLLLRNAVGDGDYAGKDFSLSAMMNGSPVVEVDDKYFVVSSQSIVQSAIDALLSINENDESEYTCDVCGSHMYTLSNQNIAEDQKEK